MGSVVVADGLSCSAACGISVPGLRIEPMSPALAGRFFLDNEGSPRRVNYYLSLNIKTFMIILFIIYLCHM